MSDLSNLKTTYTKEQRKYYLDHFKYKRNTQEHIEKLEEAVIQFSDELEEYQNAFFVAMFLMEKIIKELNVNILPLFNDNQEKLFTQLYRFYSKNDYILWCAEHDGIVNLKGDKEVVV